MKRSILVLLWATLGCGSSTPPAEAPSGSSEEAALPAAPELVCVDDNGATLECETDEDCCKGFSCAKDPEVSHRRRVCLAE